MPFITKERRKIIDSQGWTGFGLTGLQPGDMCYTFYKPMVTSWRANPKWTTADSLYRDMKMQTCQMATPQREAMELAWQVFFQLYVMPYELKKQQENGDIE